MFAPEMSPARDAEPGSVNELRDVHELGDVNELLLRLNKVKRMDMKVSVDIAGIANCTVRDVNGNLLPIVWTRQSVSNEFENATLLTRDALQKHLQTFIDAGVQENLETLQRVQDPALLVDWVVRTAEYWEKRYAQKRHEKYDISQTVFSAMFEAVVNTAWPAMETRGFDKVARLLKKKIEDLESGAETNAYHRLLMRYIAETSSEPKRRLESFFWLHRDVTAIVRMLFRSDCLSELRDRLVYLTGKLLQRKEVCNKAGAYSSQRQRSDVVQEFLDSAYMFQVWVSNLTSRDVDKFVQMLARDDWIFHVIDHTAVPVTFSNISTAPISFEHEAEESPRAAVSKRRKTTRATL